MAEVPMTRFALAPLFALALAACADPVTSRTLTDEGTACIDEAGDIEVTFPGCISSSCDTVVSATCSAELVDSVVVVTGEAVIESQGDMCTDDCGIVQATCAAPELPDGAEITISYAGTEVAIDAECAGF
jgi:hypothetical protein